MPTPSIRRATVLDSELIARLGRDTFPANFAGGPEPAGMASYLESSFTPQVIEGQIREPGSVFFIAHEGSEAVGYARLRESPPPVGVTLSPVVEVHRLYVSGRHWRQGHGKALIGACLAEAAARGCRGLWLAAGSENARSLDFYRSLGFREVGTQIFQLGQDRLVDTVLELALDNAGKRPPASKL